MRVRVMHTPQYPERGYTDVQVFHPFHPLHLGCYPGVFDPSGRWKRSVSWTSWEATELHPEIGARLLPPPTRRVQPTEIDRWWREPNQ
jgi:hypothetical protein